MMDIKIAAESMRELVNRFQDQSDMADSDYSKASNAHLNDMIDKIISGEVAGEKAHRWLGWIQGCVYCTGVAMLEEMKEINHKA